jgi:hypothetical protein
MTENNDRSHSLYNIELVQDITPETAVSYSGGAARVNDGNGDPDVILFTQDNFDGAPLNLNASIGDGFANIGFQDGQGGGGSTFFNDNVDSIEIKRGRWQFFGDAGFKGESTRIVGPGKYNDLPGTSRITSAFRIG